MALQNWSDEIVMAELAEEPSFTEDLTALMAEMEDKPRHVVLNFSAVDFLNSSNIARLLKLRKTLLSADRRLILCAINTQVWGVFLVTGLDKVFEVTDDTATALAVLQLGER
ncbi:MAG: STAS domain-containing protein [Planctomycetes bacterium]|nr:STAS domain-containing protein [Planctomycetota bacterium]